MMEILVGVIALMALGGLACGAAHALADAVMQNKPRAWLAPLNAVRQTFVPLTKREFWLPPCPLCWVTRAAAVGGLVWWLMPVTVA